MNLPNRLTILRIVLIPFFVFFLLTNYFEYSKWVALIIFTVASLTDMADGKIARKKKLVTNFGKFMDPLADKILTYSALCLLVEDKLIWAVFLIIILFREFAVAGIRMLAAVKGTVIAADIFGKIKTVLQMASIILYLLDYAVLGYTPFIQQISDSFCRTVGYIAYWTFILSVIMTVISGINYIVKNKEVLKDD